MKREKNKNKNQRVSHNRQELTMGRRGEPDIIQTSKKENTKRKKPVLLCKIGKPA